MSNFDNQGFFSPPPMRCQALVNELVLLGMTAHYISDRTILGEVLVNMTVKDVVVYSHSGGESVTLLGDNEIDIVRFKFPFKGGPVR